MLAPILETGTQTVRNGCRACVVDPERLAPFAQHIVELEKINDALPAIAKRAIENPRGVRQAAAAPREEIRDRLRRQLNHDNGRRLQGLQKPGGQSHGNTVSAPELLPIARVDVDTAKAQIR